MVMMVVVVRVVVVAVATIHNTIPPALSASSSFRVLSRAPTTTHGRFQVFLTSEANQYIEGGILEGALLVGMAPRGITLLKVSI